MIAQGMVTRNNQVILDLPKSFKIKKLQKCRIMFQLTSEDQCLNDLFQLTRFEIKPTKL